MEPPSPSAHLWWETFSRALLGTGLSVRYPKPPPLGGGAFTLGGYLVNHGQKYVSSRMCLAVFLLMSLCTFFVSWKINSLSDVPLETAYEYLSPNVVIAYCALFVFCIKIRINCSAIKFFSFLSKRTFPAYFMHLLVMETIKNGFLGFSINSYFVHPVIGIFLLSFLTLLISLAISSILRIIQHSHVVIG